VLVIARPGGGNVPALGAAVALSAAFMIALISIQIRDLARTEHPLSIVFWFAAFTVPVLAIAMPFVMTRHAAYEWGLLAGLALFGLLGQFLLTAALRFGAVASVIVMDYSSIVWATLFGWLVFGHLPPATTWLGAPLIVGAGLVIAWREHRLAIVRPGPPITP
jgi:drug/metabolite transporter (DMT)-like permease